MISYSTLVLSCSTNTDILYFTVAPSFWMMPQSIMMPEAQQINLICDSNGTPTPHISWYLNGKEIESDHYNVRMEMAQQYLVFPNQIHLII